MMDDAERAERYGHITAEDYWLKEARVGFTLPMVLQSRHAFPELKLEKRRERAPK